MELIRIGAPTIIADNLGRPLVRLPIRSPSRAALTLFLDCPAESRLEALELALQNRAEGPLRLEEARLCVSRVSSGWGPALAGRVIVGYRRLPYAEFARFWDQPIPPRWLSHGDPTGLAVSDDESDPECIHYWFLNDALILGRVLGGGRDRRVRRQLYDLFLGAFTRCRGDLFLVSDRPSVFTDADDEALVAAALAERREDLMWLAQIFRVTAELAGRADEASEEEEDESGG